MSDLERRGDELLAAIGSRAGDIGDRQLTLHWPTVGAAFDHGVLVVGQAVFGWMNSWTALNVKEPGARAGVIAQAKDPFDGLRDPMGWIEGHRVRNSPFWRVAHEVTNALAPGDSPWFSRLAWANLYPVAPNDVKGNPGGALLEAQTGRAAAFLDAAIRDIQPRLVLVTGGPYVWPYVEPLGLGVLEPTRKPLYLTGRRGGIDWIVGMHPGGASRRGWGPGRYADLIVTTARSISGAAHEEARGLIELDGLLALARDADPANRITLRDPIAAHGELAIEVMTDWLGDPRLAAFAIRVIEQIGREPAQRSAVVDVLMAVDRTELPEYLSGDLDRALASLGITKASPSRRRSTSDRAPRDRPIGTPGRAGIGYWVMRTSPWDRAYIWAEAQRGRLRQGWGWDETQNLDVIAEAVRRGAALNDLQKLAWRARRMRTSADDGMRVGDVVVAPNLPGWGRLSVYRLVGSYHWAPEDIGQIDRFGHVLPVELVAGDIDRRSPRVSDALRSMLRPQTRLYSIKDYGGDVERLASSSVS